MKKIIILIALCIMLTSCGTTNGQTNTEESKTEVRETKEETSKAIVSKEIESEIESESETETASIFLPLNENTQETESEPEGYFLIRDIDMDMDEMKEIYTELKDGWSKADNSDPDYEDKVIEKVAANHNITADQAGNIYIWFVDYGAPKAKSYYSIKYGEFKEANANEYTLVIKAKISPSATNELTIAQNYYNVCDIIRKQGGDEFDEIQYWAVADMTSGEENKVISFTVPKELIDIAKSDDFPDNMLGDYVEDLYIHPSLLK